MGELTAEQVVKQKYPNAYVQWSFSQYAYVVWSTNDPSEKNLGSGSKRYEAWADAAKRITEREK